VRASFDRTEIFYRVQPKQSVNEQIHAFVSAHTDEPGIVYRSTRKSADETAAYLASRGIEAASYHAGLSDIERQARQDAFVRDLTTVIVATIAFGMGIDKSNIRWIVHGDLPRSIEGYYQETGRAARDGEPATALMFFGPGDISKVRYHIDRTESAVERERAEVQLREILRYVDSSACRRKQLLAHFDETHAGDCGGCDVCAGEVELVDETVAAQKILSAAVRTGQRFGAHHLVDVVVGSATDKVLSRGHNELPTFGVGSDRPRQFWLALIRDLEAAEYVIRDGGRVSGYRVSGKGRLLLKGKETFLARRRDAGRVAGGGSGPGGADSTSVTGGARYTDLFGGSRLDPEEAGRLFQCLKQLRTRLAREAGVPPYVVFSDKSLRAMVERVPDDEESFLACHGVGMRKLERYGKEFLEAIRRFRASGECGPSEV
jgi:ATP-dependent DNA helicase RecQ